VRCLDVTDVARELVTVRQTTSLGGRQAPRSHAHAKHTQNFSTVYYAKIKLNIFSLNEICKKNTTQILLSGLLVNQASISAVSHEHDFCRVRMVMLFIQTILLTILFFFCVFCNKKQQINKLS